MVVDPKARQQPRVASVFKDGRTDRTFLKNSWLEIVVVANHSASKKKDSECQYISPSQDNPAGKGTQSHP
jgi:hypothetical protein